ncbi:MAG: hypothetical protein R3B06_10275 [Kofleriaceae bacterium]
MRGGGALALAALGVALAGAAGCRGGRVVRAEPPCQAVARRAEAWLAAAPTADRAAALRLAVELVDLCQAGAWSGPGRTCVATAASPRHAASCPTVHLVHRGPASPAAGAATAVTGDAPGEADGDVDAGAGQSAAP